MAQAEASQITLWQNILRDLENIKSKYYLLHKELDIISLNLKDDINFMYIESGRKV